MVGPKVLQPTNFNSMNEPSVSDSILVVEAQELEPSDPDYLADPIKKKKKIWPISFVWVKHRGQYWILWSLRRAMP